MTQLPGKNPVYTGIALAIAAALVWSGNFIVASGIAFKLPPVSLAFYRWLLATLAMTPLALPAFKQQRSIVFASAKYFFWISLTGIACFNTFIYIAAQSLSPINLVLIATTSSPVMSAILAAIFLKEKFTWLTLAGIILCISGVVVLVSKGNISNTTLSVFSPGNWWVLLAALMFAIYNIMARKKPGGISPAVFLFVIFGIGTILLLPAFIWETIHLTSTSSTYFNTRWNTEQLAPWNFQQTVLMAILYLALGASVVAYLCWNGAIKRLGAARTALFGNLIPIFSALEAVVILGDKITRTHIISGVLVLSGLLIANFRRKRM
jgi:drug/metabolite transporter (DMT)-like permease